MSGALIVTAGLGDADFVRFDRLRCAHYPVERNQLPAHLTMFHALPPSAEAELAGLLKQLTAAPPPAAFTAGLIDLDGGVAVRIRSDELTAIRRNVADHLHGNLAAQDRGGWRPHITIQNKVDPKQSRRLLAALSQDWKDTPVRIASLELYRYRGGPWERAGRYPFRY